MPMSLWFVVKSNRFKGCQSTIFSPPSDPRRVEAEEIVLAKDRHICEHPCMARPAQLVAADRLKIFGLSNGDPDRVRDKPRLIHATRDWVSLDFEARDSERVEHVCARDVQNYRSAPATANGGGARAIRYGNLEDADHFVAVRIDEPPTPLEPDHVDVESVRVVRGILQIRVQRERVESQAKEERD